MPIFTGLWNYTRLLSQDLLLIGVKCSSHVLISERDECILALRVLLQMRWIDCQLSILLDLLSAELGTSHIHDACLLLASF